MTILTLTEAKLHCRVDGSEEDALLSLYLEAAEGSAAEYLNRVIYPVDIGADLTGIVINGSIKAAILLTVGHLYANREGVTVSNGQNAAELPMGVKYLLNPYRLEMGV